jgi:L-lactate dehydrogenase complex protein LldG
VRWEYPDFAELGVDEAVAAAGLSLIPLPGFRAGMNTLKIPVAGAGVGLTAADFALAASGTLVLLTAPGHERSLSLLPPVHVSLLPASAILESMDDLAPVLAAGRGREFRGLTLVSGPSLTGDIEMVPVFGVHGPGRLIVVVYSSG